MRIMLQILLCIAAVLPAQARSDEAEMLFVRRIVPLFLKKCLACHGDDEAKINGGLDMRTSATIHAVRLIWRDIGLDTKNDVKLGPFHYRVELETTKDRGPRFSTAVRAPKTCSSTTVNASPPPAREHD